jgi:cysteine desulfurase/selenocysteine lyase
METAFNTVPHKFEAGTPYIEGAFGLKAAVEYLEHVGMDEVRKHEKNITEYAYKTLKTIKGLRIFGPDDIEERAGVIAFHLDGIHPHDIAQVLNEDNICVRVGFHCAMPLHEYLGIGPTVRASFNIYNDNEDIDALFEGLNKVKKIFK